MAKVGHGSWGVPGAEPTAYLLRSFSGGPGPGRGAQGRDQEPGLSGASRVGVGSRLPGRGCDTPEVSSQEAGEASQPGSDRPVPPGKPSAPPQLLVPTPRLAFPASPVQGQGVLPDSEAVSASGARGAVSWCETGVDTDHVSQPQHPQIWARAEDGDSRPGPDPQCLK